MRRLFATLALLVGSAYANTPSLLESQRAFRSIRAEGGFAAVLLIQDGVSSSPQSQTSVAKQGPSWHDFAALLGALLAALFTYLATSAANLRIRRLEIKLNYVQSQLDELYGPLLGECFRTDAMFLKAEEAIAIMFPNNDHHHTNLARLLTLPRTKEGGLQDDSNVNTFFGHIIEEVSGPSNRRKLALLKNTFTFMPTCSLFFLFVRIPCRPN